MPLNREKTAVPAFFGAGHDKTLTHPLNGVFLCPRIRTFVTVRKYSANG